MPYSSDTIHQLTEFGPIVELLAVTFTQGKQAGGENYHRLYDVAGKVRALVGGEKFDIAVGQPREAWSSGKASRASMHHNWVSEQRRDETDEEVYQRNEREGVHFAHRVYQIGTLERDYAHRLGLLFAGILSAAASQPTAKDATVSTAVTALENKVAEIAGAIDVLKAEVRRSSSVDPVLEIRLSTMENGLESVRDEITDLDSKLDGMLGEISSPSVTAQEAADLREQLSEIRKQQTVLMQLFLQSRPNPAERSMDGPRATQADAGPKKQKVDPRTATQSP